MAMTYLEKMKQNQQQQNPGLQGVSENTRTQQAQYQQPYQQTQQAQTAQQNLQNVQQQKPQSYTSKYSGALDSILAQIQAPDNFKYSLDGDGLFQYFKDMYTQKAKQGAQDTMGIAAGMTGGYGNSWAQSAGAQAYQQNLQPLYEKAVDFAALAQDRHNADRADLYNRLGAVQGAEQTDYDRYRDLMGDYNADVDRAREDYRYEDETGYNRYMDAQKYWTDQAAAENADYRTGQDQEYRYTALDEEARQADQNEAYRRDAMAQDWQTFQETNKLDWANLEEKQRQFDAELTEDQRQYNQKVAMAYVTDILANGQIPSNELLVAAGLSLEDAQKMIAKAAGNGGKKTTGKVQALVDNAADTMNAYAAQQGRDTAYLYGKGLTGAVQNSTAYANRYNQYMDMAKDESLPPEYRKAAQELAAEAGNAAYSKVQTEKDAEAYYAKLLAQNAQNKKGK